MSDDVEPVYRIGLLTPEERHAHGQQWVAHCRAQLAAATVQAGERPTHPATPHQPDDEGDTRCRF